tara:strand:- start:289 stop:1167 length:879 start_codon:yes stop_codon:yes gene_type:complete
MDIAIYQNNTGSAPAIHWWLSQELNIGPELYDFNTGYCTPSGNHVGAIVIEDENAKYHQLHKQSMLLLDNPVNEAGIVDALAPFNDIKSEFDYFVWSNYSGNLINPETIIKADKSIIVDNSAEEQLFFYISQYAFAWIDTIDDVTEQTESWAREHNIENWKEVWDSKYAKTFEQAFRDGKLNYMWQLNFAHNDLMEQLQHGKDDITLVDADDHARLFEVKKQEQDFTDTLFEYTNREIDHIVVGDDWFNNYEEILKYADVLSSFRLKKYIIDYTKLYKRKKALYHDTFSKYL